MIITKQQSRVLLASIQYCKEQGMDDDWMEGYLIQEIEYLSKLHQPTVSGRSEHLVSFLRWYVLDESKRSEPDNINNVVSRYLNETNCH
jgi:hypothetical protein